MVDLKNIVSVCINLSTRKDKRQFMQKQCQRRGLSIQFYLAEPNADPKRGCLESHLAVIEEQIKKGSNFFLMLEDDAKFIANPRIPDMPDDWDMLYLGGNVRNLLEDSEEAKKKPWVKMRCWTTHAYLINLRNKELVKDILLAKTMDKEIDNFYIDHIHGKYNCYMLNPMIAIQKDGYSDIEKTEVNYDFMTRTLFGFQKPEHDVTEDGHYVLKLPNMKDEELPNVSIITPTYNRKRMFQMVLHSVGEANYPKEKIEWVVIDDTPPRFGTVEELVTDFGKNHGYDVNYVRLDLTEDGKPNSIARKRNIGALRAKHNFIVHMDDDDYYPPESILARIKLLMKYTDKQCVGCSTIGTYNIVKNTSTMASDGDLTLSEASMAYTRKFWLERPFVETEMVGEYAGFIADRYDKVIDAPYSFIIIGISHYENFTSRTAKKKTTKTEEDFESKLIDKRTGKKMNYFDMWDEETQLFINDLRRTITK